MVTPLGLAYTGSPPGPILRGCPWGIREGSGSELQGSWGNLKGWL